MDKETIINNINIILAEMQIKVSEPVLNLYVDKVIRYILNYTNRTKLPNELCYTVIDMVVNTCESQATKVNNGGVASLSEGGRSVSFVTSVSRLPEIVQFDKDVTRILNKFKLVYKEEADEVEKVD